jgi:hypothetical protein
MAYNTACRFIVLTLFAGRTFILMQHYRLPRAVTWPAFTITCLILTACSSSDDPPAPVNPAPRRVVLKTPTAPPVEAKKVEVEEVAKKVDVQPVEETKPDPDKPVSATAEKKKKSKSSDLLRRIFRKRTTSAPAAEPSERSARYELLLGRREWSV